jgi:hypothetical protein
MLRTRESASDLRLEGLPVKTSDQIAVAAVVVSGLALLATVAFAVLNRRYTRTQIALTREQLAASTEQFERANKPNVHFHVFTRSKPIGAEGVYVKVTNNHPSIPVGDIKMWLEAPGSDGTRTWLFLMFEDLPPQKTTEVRNAVTLAQMVKHFTGDGSREGLLIAGDVNPGPTFESYALAFRFSYVPRQEGATKIEDVLECHLHVLRS